MSQKAFNRPQPREGPQIPYKNESGSNPVLRGYTLAIASSIIASSKYVQSIFWSLNRFDKLKEIKELRDYGPRHDPSVIPRVGGPQEVLALKDLSQPRLRSNPAAYYTCADYHELYKSGKLTPLDVAQYLIPLIQRDSKPPGKYSVSFLQVREDLVLEAAKASTERYKAGKPLSVLDGVPIAVKDEVDVTGYRLTRGSKLDFFKDKGDRTAWCVTKWIEAGVLLIGKTNMHEMGLDTTNNNVNYGTPLNPHNQGYYTGGSSGGSACAVAQGLCPFALGVDGGGSIRLPASFCGLYGLKPTHGRVSARAGPEVWDSVAANGPMASNIEDLAIAYRIMAQPDPQSRTSASFPETIVKDPVGVRPEGGKKYLGVFQDWVNRSDYAVLEMFNRAINYLVKAQGYEVVHITIPFIPEGQKAHALTILSEVRTRLTQPDISKLTCANQLLLNVAGSHATTQDFLFAQRMRYLHMSHLQWLWEKYPGMLVLTPTTPCAGWKIKSPSDITGYGVSDGDMSLRSMEYVFFANWTGCPAISCPMGYSEGDVPVGLMAMAEWGMEEQLLEFAHESEGALGETGIRQPKPSKQWVDVLSDSIKS